MGGPALAAPAASHRTVGPATSASAIQQPTAPPKNPSPDAARSRVDPDPDPARHSAPAGRRAGAARPSPSGRTPERARPGRAEAPARKAALNKVRAPGYSSGRLSSTANLCSQFDDGSGSHAYGEATVEWPLFGAFRTGSARDRRPWTWPR
jgi:hypothetical protein